MVSDYGELLGRQDGGYDLGIGRGEEERMDEAYGGIKEEELLNEKEEDGDDDDNAKSDSGSSIDLHTPLPCVLFHMHLIIDATDP